MAAYVVVKATGVNMEMLHDFHFLRPWLWLLLIPALALLYVRSQTSGMGAWRKLVAPELLAYLQMGKARASSKTEILALVVLLLLMIAALAGPVWQKLAQPVYSQAQALVVVLDLSASMNAQDIKPSRLIRAKQKLTDVLHQRQEGQTALVVFAGSAFVVTPLTDDNATILSQLQGLTTDIMPVQGGDIDAGLSKALQLLRQASVQHGNILLLTDSDKYSKAKLEQITQAGFAIHVIGVGTPSGAPMPQANGGFIHDDSGQIVVAKLNEQNLQRLALLGQGAYHRLSIDDSDIALLIKPSLQERLTTGEQKTDVSFDVWQEEGHWLLLLAMPLFALLFRRGALFALCLVLWQPTPSQAGVWQDLWQTPDKQGEVLMQQKDYAKAYQSFEDPAWKVSAAYRNHDYQAAMDTFKQIEQPNADDWYNHGNALAHTGKLDEAIAAYDAALKHNPNHVDAQANKVLVEKLKKQQQDKDGDKGKEKNKNKDKGKNKKQGSSKQDGSKQDKGQQGEQDKKQQGQSKQGKSQEQQGKQKKQGQDKTNQDKQAQEAQQQPSDSKAKQDKKDKAAQAKQEQSQQQGKDKQAQVIPSDEQPKSEAQQAFEQTLRRVPDDPSGLLRRKFLYQYKRQAGQVPQRGQAW
ncbi:MAG: VWA domain-containing protein [Ghiorsea sp.]|nr:VWA domain-containing protein [Ghiorsea sp.]